MNESHKKEKGHGDTTLALLHAASPSQRPLVLYCTLWLAQKEAAGHLKTLEMAFIDTDRESLDNLLLVVSQELKRYAERHLVFLRPLYRSFSSLVSNGDIVDYFCRQVLKRIWATTQEATCFYAATLIFGAGEENTGPVYTDKDTLNSFKTGYWHLEEGTLIVSGLEEEAGRHAKNWGHTIGLIAVGG